MGKNVHTHYPNPKTLTLYNICSTNPNSGNAIFRFSLKTGPAQPGKTRPGFLKILQQLIHMNLSIRRISLEQIR